MSSNTHQSAMERNHAFMAKVEDLVREIIIQNNIPYYRIESRMEHNAHANGGQTYLPVVRIITYFEDSVGPISAVLRSEFDVEIGAPKDKEVIKVDSFSSKHIEYKVTLKANRLDLIEYKRYGTQQFEIQACSMIQDAWNGLEKELGYTGGTIPAEARRDFYRVGALLEMADIEFLKIRGLLNNSPKAAHTAIIKEQAEPQIFTPQPAIKESAPAPQTVAPIQEVAQETKQPLINIFSVKPVAAGPVMEEPAVVAKEVNTAINGIAPQRVAVGNMTEMASSMNMHGYSNQPAAATNVNSVNNTKQPIGIVQEILSDLVVNMMPLREQPAPVAQPAAPIMQQPAPIYIPPEAPIAEKTPEQPNMINTERLNINTNGVVEKVAEAAREQPAAPQFYDEKQKQPQTIDENAQMTDGSLKEYVRNSKLLREVDLKISVSAGAKLNDEIDIEGDVERLKFLKVFSLRQLHERLADNRNDIIAFAEKWIGKDNGGSFDMGISLFYLEYLLVGKKNDPGFAVEYVLKFISDNDYSARYIIPTYNSIRQTDSPISKFSHLTLK